MMRLDCLRHGVTVENRLGLYHGRAHGTLTAEQTAALQATAFDVSPYDAIYCSPLGRCVDTARALRIGTWQLDARLAERDFGIFEGLNGEQCRQRFPQEFEQFLRFDADFAPGQGESRAVQLQRIRDWLQDVLVHRHVLAITHGGTVDFLYRLSQRIPLHGGSVIHGGGNAALSRFDVSVDGITLLEFGMPLANA